MNHAEAGKKGFEKTKDILLAQVEYRSKNAREKYEADPKFCPFCGESISYERRFAKFCNSSCSASYNNQGVTRNPRKVRICTCGKPILGKGNKYCPECIEKRVYNKYHSLEDAPDDRVRKRIVLEQRGHKCEDCGLTEWRGQAIPLELHHIDGNSDNNLEKNLRLICPNCHALTETYKGANTGKNSSRQITRRKRYANGQTW